MQQQKAIIRKQLINKRKLLSAGTVDRVSQNICIRAFASIDWSNVQTVCTYEPAANSGEIDTAPLLALLSRLPNPPTVTMVESQAHATIPQGMFNVIIVPVVGFDEENYRLGQGGGWYDRFLASQPHACTIGLAHATSKTSFPHEPHDIPLDHIITEETGL